MIDGQVARALTLTIIDLSAAPGHPRRLPQLTTTGDPLARAGHGSLLLRDREHPQDRRAEQPGRRKAAANPSTVLVMAPVRLGCPAAALRIAPCPLRLTITLISNFNNERFLCQYLPDILNPVPLKFAAFHMINRRPLIRVGRAVRRLE